ncbi:hypothetical protein CC1G_00753 [Coprinopsis cinerea okayama7|uniref:BTB domain-containing protein n=1 Tax=Coprinopsis cinerea (strain Okayama-7 / 130 / ATCC MYA-4618 / FGSC 9003) TaxID=240176 RepID=A8N9D9_COPC7|nr:hypothetical protein CC1G_00753 [Coprinopsis cinerea okayama7\|eukprot:XP_001831206.1 hypothetical protein CC1G_00753 [Coprinopsis cinerea okayama7\
MSSTLASEPCTPRLAAHPFDHPEADLILRSSDPRPTDYHVFKLLLTLSSPFFCTLFTLPQPSASKDGLGIHEVPVIQMAEDKQVLDVLLGFCYPLSAHALPRFTSLTTLQKVANAAIKFDMEGIVTHTRSELVAPRFVDSQPFRVYALASQYGWVHEMSIAARCCLRRPMPGPYASEVKDMPPDVYKQLKLHHRTCGDIARSQVLRNLRVIPESRTGWVWWTCRKCPPLKTEDIADKGSSPISTLSLSMKPRKWWAEWLDDVAAQVGSKPLSGSVRSKRLLARALEKAARCSTCSRKSREDLECFSQTLDDLVRKDLLSVGSVGIIF